MKACLVFPVGGGQLWISGGEQAAIGETVFCFVLKKLKSMMGVSDHGGNRVLWIEKNVYSS